MARRGSGATRTEISAVSASWTDTLSTLRAWRAQRLPHALFVPAAAALALASAVGQPIDASLGPRVGVAWVALASLRLWDDLEDREADRRTHADRVWLGDHPRRVGLVAALGFCVAALWAPLGFAALAGATALFYRVRATPAEAVLLLKYPALVGLLRGSLDVVGAGAMALVYGAMRLDAGHRAPGAVAVWVGTLALLPAAPLAGGIVLAVGLALPWAHAAFGRPATLAGVVIQLLASHLGTP